MHSKKYLLVPLTIGLLSCAGIKFQAQGTVSQEAYIQNKNTHGVVVLDVNWGRWWSCGGYENAQLISLAFDKLPATSLDDEAEPSLTLQTPSKLFVDPQFINHAHLLAPGEYALSAINIKVARSVSDVGFLSIKRKNLYKEGKPAGGTFQVNAGETVFIGNFFLDCAYGPTLWRYYPETKRNFERQIQEYKKSYPFLDLSDVKFRLFKTKEFGYDYELPK